MRGSKKKRPGSRTSSTIIPPTGKDETTMEISDTAPTEASKGHPLPAREFSKSTLSSLVSNALLVTGTGLTFFDTKALKITGAAATTLAFGTKQVHDYFENNKSRKNIKGKEQELAKDKGENTLPVITNLLNNYGLDVDAKVVITTLLNTALQLTSLAFTVTNVVKTQGEPEGSHGPLPDWSLLVVTLLAYGLDFLEQHLKKDNLRRRDEQLDSIKADTSENPKLQKQ